MSQQNTSERLAALEAKLDIFMKLLTEIRDDLKDHPSSEDIAEMKARLFSSETKIVELEKGQDKLAIKLAVAGTFVTAIMSFVARYLIR